MEKFKYDESVVINFPNGGSASGKIVNEVDDDYYLVAFGYDGTDWKYGFYHASQLTSFGVALFLVTESYDAQQAELAEVAD